jgi:hypothetical protein
MSGEDTQCMHFDPDRCEAPAEFVIAGHVQLEDDDGGLHVFPVRAHACNPHLGQVFNKVCLVQGSGKVTAL